MLSVVQINRNAFPSMQIEPTGGCLGHGSPGASRPQGSTGKLHPPMRPCAGPAATGAREPVCARASDPSNAGFEGAGSVVAPNRRRPDSEPLRIRTPSGFGAGPPIRRPIIVSESCALSARLCASLCAYPSTSGPEGEDTDPIQPGFGSDSDPTHMIL